MSAESRTWPGLPRFALGTAVLAVEKLRALGRALNAPGAPGDSARHIPTGLGDPDALGALGVRGDLGPRSEPIPPGEADTVVGLNHIVHDYLPDDLTMPLRDTAFEIAVGVAQQSADAARRAGQRLFDAAGTTAKRVESTARSVGDAARSVGDTARGLGITARRVGGGTLSFRGTAGGAVLRPQQNLHQARSLVREAGARGRQTISTSRVAALGTLRAGMDSGIAWAETMIIPRMIDDLMPYLVKDVVPRLVEGALPEIRAKIIPVVIDDLTRDPQVRELITEQSRGVLSDATDELRTTSASADDRVEASFRRLFHVNPNANGDR